MAAAVIALVLREVVGLARPCTWPGAGWPDLARLEDLRIHVSNGRVSGKENAQLK